MFQIQITFLILLYIHLSILQIIQIKYDILFLIFVTILNSKNILLHGFHFLRLFFDARFEAPGISYELSQDYFLFLTKFH